MAENKKSFLMYCDMIHSFDTLTDDEAGKLVKHLFRYVNDMSPEAPDRFTEKMFEPIKHKLKEALVKWEETKKKRAEAGSKGGQVTVANRNKGKQDEANQAIASIIQANQAVTVTETVFNDLTSLNQRVDVEVAPAGTFEPKLTPDQITVNELRNESQFQKEISGTKVCRHTDFMNQCLSEEVWKESIFIKKILKPETIALAMKDYNIHLTQQGDMKLSIKDYKSHFINWVNKKKELNQKQTVTSGRL